MFRRAYIGQHCAVTGRGLIRFSKDGRRLLWNVPPYEMQPEDDALKVRLDRLVPPWCLDYCHVKGRGPQRAEALIRPDWKFLDIKAAHASIYLPRLWAILRKLDRALERDVHSFVDRLGCDTGLPDGAACAHALFNIYLSSVDARWQGRAVHYADNIATANRQAMRKELHDIGLASRRPAHLHQSPTPGPEISPTGRPQDGRQERSDVNPNRRTHEWRGMITQSELLCVALL